MTGPGLDTDTGELGFRRGATFAVTAPGVPGSEAPAEPLGVLPPPPNEPPPRLCLEVSDGVAPRGGAAPSLI